MAKLIICAPTPSSGVRHRYILMRQVKGFADKCGYAVRMLWPVTNGVSLCKHEELFAPVVGVEIENVSPNEHAAIVKGVLAGRVHHRGEWFSVLQAGEKPGERFFCWDLAGSGYLARLAGGNVPHVWAKPCAALQAELDIYIKRNTIEDRLGIRVRVEEVNSRERRPRRIQSELDAALKALFKIPWYVRVFLVTDSEYVQQTLASHFMDAVFLPKRFGQREATGRYIFRKDRQEMVTFLKEVSCLCACRKVINIGGFLNDGQVRSRLILEPYEEAAFLNVKRV